MPTANVRNTTISYEEKGGGPPLVLLHGFPLDNRIWREQLSHLSASHRIIAPDLRGFGQSTSKDSFTIESLADDVHAFLGKIGALPCVLGGLSMGGYVALAYVKKYPTDLRGLVLIDSKAEGDTAAGREGRDKMVELVRSSGSKAVADQMMPKMLAEDTAKNRPEQVKRMRQIMESCPPLTIEHALLAMRDRPDHMCNLPSIPVPTLMIVGEHDAITPPSVAEAVVREIPNAQLVVVRGAGHMAPLEQPSQVNQALRQFLKGLAS